MNNVNKGKAMTHATTLGTNAVVAASPCGMRPWQTESCDIVIFVRWSTFGAAIRHSILVPVLLVRIATAEAREAIAAFRANRGFTPPELYFQRFNEAFSMAQPALRSRAGLPNSSVWRTYGGNLAYSQMTWTCFGGSTLGLMSGGRLILSIATVLGTVNALKSSCQCES
jgi:hypothetical protein